MAIGAAITGVFGVGSAGAEVSLPAIFGDHMVVQRSIPLAVFGTADAGETVTVELAGRTATATAGGDGRWRATLDPIDDAGPHEMRVTGSASDAPVTFADVLAGEVWLCSGQSNMEWPVSASDDAAAEIAAADHPTIRLFTVEKNAAATPADDVRGEWRVCSPATVGDFSAVGYFMGRKLNADLGVPVGLIDSSWGGTPAEAWTSRHALAGSERFAPLVADLDLDAADLPAAKARYDAALAAWRERNEPADPGVSDEAKGWAARDFDDAGWPTADLPGSYDDVVKSDGRINGAVWFRRTVELPADLPTSFAGGATLSLGAIDDFDETYFNGVRVGATGRDTSMWWQHRRAYPVPRGLLRAGRNVVAVRVWDQGGAGGLLGPASAMSLAPADPTADPAGDQVAAAVGPIPLAGAWRYRVELAVAKPDAYEPQPTPPPLAGDPHTPTVLYNGMVAPLVPYAIRGAAWYQGESNAGRAAAYAPLLTAMVEGWRSDWDQPGDARDFPFLIVHLAGFMAPVDAPVQRSAWPEVRESQRVVARDLPNAALASAVDVGAADDVHPTDKQTVGARLALAAEELVYGMDVVGSGPTPAGTTFGDGRAVVTFESVGGGLRTSDGKPPGGFAVAGDDRAWHAADAAIQGDTVVLTSSDVPNPVAVRYAWADNPTRANLRNVEGLPAVPFRTDDWPLVTAGK